MTKLDGRLLLISIHAPAWGRDLADLDGRLLFYISIHAPAWGRDTKREVLEIAERNFNPRARMGARQIFTEYDRVDATFQSTRPHGGATRGHLDSRPCENISIHAPAWGRDLAQGTSPASVADFNPRARMGARLPGLAKMKAAMAFQSTRPHGGATPDQRGNLSISSFQSTRPHGGATASFHAALTDP